MSQHHLLKHCLCIFILYVLFFQGNILQQILSFGFILELVNTVPFLMTVSNQHTIIWIFYLIIKFRMQICIIICRCLFIDFLQPATFSVFACISELLVSQSSTREHAEWSPSCHAKNSISSCSTTHAFVGHHWMPRVHEVTPLCILVSMLTMQWLYLWHLWQSFRDLFLH